ncbi:hypothetical protein FX985_03542 [Pseudomonas extremaustralis]|uniref:Protein activator of alkane oxidation PraB n=1 Tax=Pseudomonas extremaustralis TaxID=359110 RepID=A0A5M9J5G7_9PSED|nr:alkane oxidation protein activator PraB [Pseudomonas extremaustralis]KAA8563473.1 hypothetical protein FX985_03542 [Pseudomonas extremaustralis]
MGSLITLVNATSITLCLALGAVANAASFSPPGATFSTSAAGTITIKSPSTFGAAVTCGITLAGVISADGADAKINTVSFSGGPGCALYQPTHLAWNLTPKSISTGSLNGLGLTYTTTSPVWPTTNCGPSNIALTLANTTDGLSFHTTNQALSGSCAIVGVDIVVLGVTVNP